MQLTEIGDIDFENIDILGRSLCNAKKRGREEFHTVTTSKDMVRGFTLPTNNQPTKKLYIIWFLENNLSRPSEFSYWFDDRRIREYNFLVKTGLPR